MVAEDYASRCAAMAISIKRSRISLMRIALAMTFVRSTVTYFKDKCLDSLTDLEELQNKQSGMKAEAENARFAYNFMKQKVTHKDDEISSLEREV